MNPRTAIRDRDLEALILANVGIPPVADAVRERSLFRARNIVVEQSSRELATQEFAPRGMPRRRILLFAPAFALVLLIGILGAYAAFRNRVEQPAPTALRPKSKIAPSLTVATIDSPSKPMIAESMDPLSAKAGRSARHSVNQRIFSAELNLLRRIQDAYKHRNFETALHLIGVHGRRFPNGQLTEERDFLRVKSLAGAGRLKESHRGAALFARRYPRSVLLPRVVQDPL